MKNDRVIHISTGASRKSVSWQQVETTWSDFCERLRTPQRGRETIAEYLAMPKSRQDELKDVGGELIQDSPRQKSWVISAAYYF